MKCTRCGNDTERNALASEADDIEESENGVIWLCDGCMEELDNWMKHGQRPRRGSIIPELNSGERDMIEDAEKIDVRMTEIEFIHMARDGSMTFQYDIATVIESTESGQVFQLKPEDVL